MEPTKQALLQMAFHCRTLGIVPIPTSDKKRAVAKWKHYTEYPPDESETIRSFNFSFTKGIAVLCGPASGNLEVIDVDTKNDLTGQLMRTYYNAIHAANPQLAKKLVIQQTRSGGYHLFYRCPAVEKSQPLARRPSTEAELLANPDQKIRVLIETRGKSGTACISPSNGYRFVRGSLQDIPLITSTERDLLLTKARMFNTIKEKAKITRQYRFTEPDPVNSPIDDYNNRGDIVQLLESHGWTIYDQYDIITIFKRPGDTDKESSGNYNHSRKLFSTFSTSTQFEANKGYTPAHVFIELECNGDEIAGVKELLRRGYGRSYNEQRERQNQQKRLLKTDKLLPPPASGNNSQKRKR